MKIKWILKEEIKKKMKKLIKMKANHLKRKKIMKKNKIKIKNSMVNICSMLFPVKWLCITCMKVKKK